MPDEELDVDGHEVVLAARPEPNTAVSSSHFATRAHNPSRAMRHVPAGAVVASTLTLSVDPFQRCRFNESTGVEYTEPYGVGEPISSAGIGLVTGVGDGVSGVEPGDLVIEPFDGWPWQTTAVLPAGRLTVVPRGLAAVVPPRALLSTVGQTGLTAYFAVEGLGDGDVLVISGAGGAVGLAAAQLARAAGVSVVGIHGNPAKGDALRRLGCGAVSYREHASADALGRAVAEALGGGSRAATAYLDMVGGWVSDGVIPRMAPGGAIVLCGQISMYDTDEEYPPPLPEESRAVASELGVARERYLVLDHAPRFHTALAALCEWVAGNRIEVVETRWDGLNRAPEAFVAMMSGENVGKALVEVAPPPFDLRCIEGLRSALPPETRALLARTFATPDKWLVE